MNTALQNLGTAAGLIGLKDLENLKAQVQDLTTMTPTCNKYDEISIKDIYIIINVSFALCFRNN